MCTVRPLQTWPLELQVTCQSAVSGSVSEACAKVKKRNNYRNPLKPASSYLSKSKQIMIEK
jgi:hypothetical protein